ncbi:MAG: hypothetical protein F6K47_08850 [Symploca sp. SIO2E6]|nr:hypothetical protein [Symploca sp. SIO2E6]
MAYKLMITWIGAGLISYLLTKLFSIELRTIAHFQQIMYTAVAVGLYINVISIDTQTFKKNFKTITSIILVGVPLKIFLPGTIIAWLLPGNAQIAYLCATVIAQIDPIAAARFLEGSKLSKKSETILRVWSSFDDPVTVLFAFYIFLPIALATNQFNFGQYFFYILRDIIVCVLTYFLYKKFLKSQRAKKFFDIAIVVIIIGYSSLSGSFLLPAAIGLFIRPLTGGKIIKVTLDIIFYMSAVVIASLATNLTINWFSGLILAFSTFFLAQIIVTLLFIRDSNENKIRIMFGHQNGMTAALLTVTLEMSGLESNNLFSITLPAIVLVTIFYFTSNSLIDRILPPSAQ